MLFEMLCDLNSPYNTSYANIGSGNGLALISCQAINRINGDQDI